MRDHRAALAGRLVVFLWTKGITRTHFQSGRRCSERQAQRMNRGGLIESVCYKCTHVLAWLDKGNNMWPACPERGPRSPRELALQIGTPAGKAQIGPSMLDGYTQGATHYIWNKRWLEGGEYGVSGLGKKESLVLASELELQGEPPAL